MFKQLGLIGCGLMGGSFALALRKAGLVKRVVGYSKSPSTTEQAKRQGVIDVAAESALQAASGSDLVLLAVPVAATEATLRSIASILDPSALVMDVGSTKVDVVAAARRAMGHAFGSFVPAHPIAGKATAGIGEADAGLYDGHQLILTPVAETSMHAVQLATDTWSALGCQVLKMSPENHDAAFAAVSHLPHMLAFAYFNAVARQPAGKDYLRLAGPGFRDFTRIAGSDPTMWRDILLANRQEVLEQSRRFRDTLGLLEQILASGDAAALETLLRQASEGRSHWRMSQSAHPKGARQDR